MYFPSSSDTTFFSTSLSPFPQVFPFTQLSLVLLPPRCLCLRPVHHHHLRQCRPGGDRKPDASLPVCLPTKLHSVRLPVHHAVHRRAPCLHRQPADRHVCTQILPVQGRSAQRFRCSVHSGRLDHAGGDTLCFCEYRLPTETLLSQLKRTTCFHFYSVILWD